MALNLTFVHPQLAVGGSYPMSAATHLAEALGIRAVVDLRGECCDDAEVLRRCGLTLLHLPTLDMRAVSQQMLDTGVAFVTSRLALGEKVFIHCEHGVGRSALLALCVLVQLGSSPLEALTTAKDARWQISPSAEQLTAFVEWSRRLRDTTGRRFELPSLHQMGCVAYRHLAQGG